jgi:ketosteroid isomerase-like protein
LNAAALKAVGGLRVPRGFESHPLRSPAREIIGPVSQLNVESSRRLWERFLADDEAGVLELLDEAVEVHDIPELPGASVYHGHAGWRNQIAKFRDAFPEIDYQVLEHVECGQGVVSVIAAHGTGRGSGIEADTTYAQLEEWRDGKIVSIRYFLTKEAALEAGGCG